MMATFVFTVMLCVGAEGEDEARDGAMDLLAEIARNDDTAALVLEEILEEEAA